MFSPFNIMCVCNLFFVVLHSVFVLCSTMVMLVEKHKSQYSYSDTLMTVFSFLG